MPPPSQYAYFEMIRDWYILSHLYEHLYLLFDVSKSSDAYMRQ